MTKLAHGLRWACVPCLLVVSLSAGAGQMDTATPAPLVDSYDSLADAILAAKQTEWNLVHTILAGTYRHAEGILAMAQSKLDAGEPAAKELEALATLVAQIGNEGDASVAAVRKKLLEGGHHHHSSAEQQGVYDEGFVIVTREAKRVFLDAGKSIAKLARGGDRAKLDVEWKRVAQEFKKLHPAGH